MINIDLIKKLRDETGAGIVEAKKFLEDNGGDYDKAKEALMKTAMGKAAKKMDRTAGDGLIASYIHLGGKMGTLAHVGCETDFVAKTEDFKKFASEIAMQVCVGDYQTVEELLNDEYLRDPAKKVSDLLNELVAKVGEKVEIKKFIKYTVR